MGQRENFGILLGGFHHQLESSYTYFPPMSRVADDYSIVVTVMYVGTKGLGRLNVG